MPLHGNGIKPGLTQYNRNMLVWGSTSNHWQNTLGRGKETMYGIYTFLSDFFDLKQ